MRHAAVVEEVVFASTSMDVARDAMELGDWPKAEQALLDVQERSARLLREIALKRHSEGRSDVLSPELPTPTRVY